MPEPAANVNRTSTYGGLVIARGPDDVRFELIGVSVLTEQLAGAASLGEHLVVGMLVNAAMRCHCKPFSVGLLSPCSAKVTLAEGPPDGPWHCVRKAVNV